MELGESVNCDQKDFSLITVSLLLEVYLKSVNMKRFHVETTL